MIEEVGSVGAVCVIHRGCVDVELLRFVAGLYSGGQAPPGTFLVDVRGGDVTEQRNRAVRQALTGCRREAPREGPRGAADATARVGRQA